VAELVLIVDDDERNAKLARDVLERAGIATLSAATAAEALQLAREHLPDAVLMDLRLPDLTGEEAARQLAGDDRTARIPVVALTAQPIDDPEAWADAEGFAGYLAKPIDVLAFPAQVRRHFPPG
jgi:two-component system cell cycle response regulator DivK